MGLFAKAAKTAIGYPAPGWSPPGYGSLSSKTIAGGPMTYDMAMSVGAFTAGIRLIAEDGAHLPLITYKRLDPKGKERALNHPAYSLLHDSPNPEMTAMVWRETGIGHLYAWGNWYAEKELNGNGVTARLWPLRPDRMAVSVDRTTGKRVYDYRLPDGTMVRIPATRIFHVPGFGFDGLVGYSRLALMRRALESAMAVEEYGLRTFTSGAQPGVTIKHKMQLTKEAKQNIATSWDEAHRGLSNAQRTAVLDEGMELDQIGFPPEDAQFLESRRFSVEEIARGLRLSPHKLSDFSRATFSNIEEANIDYVVGTLGPTLVRIEQQINKDIIADPRYFAEHLLDALLRGKTLERAQAQQVRIQSGTLSPDEAREMENQNPIADGQGDVYLAPLNMSPLDQLAAAVAARSVAEPSAPKSDDDAVTGLKAAIRSLAEPPVVNIPAPVVNVAAPVVQVAAADMEPVAEALLSLKAALRRKTPRLLRDANGRLTGIDYAE